VRAVSCRRDSPAWAGELVEQAAAAGEDIDVALGLARAYGRLLPLPGCGQTAARWQILTALGRVNLTVARVFEAHTDAIAILAEAGRSDDAVTGLTYGVFAAEGPDDPVRAEPDGRDHFLLSGTKPWCSLGSRLDVGLVTAHVTGGRQLFRVELHDPSVRAEPTSGWVARGLRTVTSTSLHFDSTPARPVGPVDWYLTRPGFSWGGIGVAACWYGGAQGLQQRLAESVRVPVDQLGALALGTVDAAMYAAGAVLAQAATEIDQARAAGAAGELLALRTRAIVVDATERTLHAVEHALGPAPLAFDEDHARRVADLVLYLRQHHAERDVAALGQAALKVSAASAGRDD
jgi:alkylation response protein AidB-like acyl-CoA dehydrogenase